MTSIPKLPSFKRHLYNYNKANFDAFNDLLSCTSLNSISELNLACTLEECIIQAADATIPKIRWQKKKLKHYLVFPTHY